MYIVAIAWIFVTFCMALTERSIVAGLLTFLFYGLAPLLLLLWLAGAAARRRRKSVAVPGEQADAPDGGDAKRDE